MELLPVQESACYRWRRPRIGEIEPFSSSAANNLDAFTTGIAVSALNLLLANGFLVVFLFLAGVAAVVAADLVVLRRSRGASRAVHHHRALRA